MNSLTALLLPLAVMFPFMNGVPAGTPSPGETGVLRLAADADMKSAPPLTKSEAASSRSLPALPLEEAPSVKQQGQVRIKQRVILRITPRSETARQDMQARLRRSDATHFEERKIGSCLKASNIAGVETTSEDRLLLFLKDRRLVSAKLGKSCSARDFYSGFYVERSKDGKICVKRDMIQSRAGARCALDQFRQLVPVRK